MSGDPAATLRAISKDDAIRLLAEYGLLRTFRVVYSNETPCKVSCEIERVRDTRSPEALRLLFVGVRELLYNQPPTGPHSCRLIVTDIRSRQLEGLNYELVDEESQGISSLAEDFECWIVGEVRA